MSLTTVIHQFVTLFNRLVILTLFINHAVWFLYISRPETPSSRFCVQTSRVSTFILSLSKLTLRSQGGKQYINQAYFDNFKFGLEVSFGRENPIFFLVSYIQNSSYQGDLNIILCLKIAMTTKSLNEIYENAIIQC